jgi:hypothetical protein
MARQAKCFSFRLAAWRYARREELFCQDRTNALERLGRGTGSAQAKAERPTAEFRDRHRGIAGAQRTAAAARENTPQSGPRPTRSYAVFASKESLSPGGRTFSMGVTSGVR